MSDPVKSNKRRYRSSLREQQARSTRKAILAAARKLFAEDGWETPISAIAREASVSKETVYAAFGTKPAILEQLIAATLRGDDEETPLIDQPERLAILADSDPRSQIRRFSTDIASLLARVAPLVDVVRSAARANPDSTALYEKLHLGRRENLQKLVVAIAGHGLLRQGLDQNSAVATVWRLASPELFLLVTRTEGVSQTEYAAWLADMLEVSLLEPEPPSRSR